MNNPREIFESINDALGAEIPDDADQKALTVSPYEHKEIIKPAPPGAGEVHDEDAVDDYDFARRSLHQLAEQAQEALNAAMEIATATGTSESFDTVATMIKTNSDLMSELIGLQEKMAKISEAKKKVQAPGGQEEEEKKTTTNVFIGSTSDLIDLLKSKGLDDRMKTVNGRVID